VADDELAGTIGSGAFYFDWGNSAATDALEALLALVMLGRVEERWSVGCRLRVRPKDEQAYTFGQWSPVPWWLSFPRRFEPFDLSVRR